MSIVNWTSVTETAEPFEGFFDHMLSFCSSLKKLEAPMPVLPAVSEKSFLVYLSKVCEIV